MLGVAGKSVNHLINLHSQLVDILAGITLTATHSTWNSTLNGTSSPTITLNIEKSTVNNRFMGGKPLTILAKYARHPSSFAFVAVDTSTAKTLF